MKLRYPVAATADGAAGQFNIVPLMFGACACSMAYMSFVTLIGPIARTLGLAPWQAGTAVTTSGMAWVVMGRIWGEASDRRGRRRVLLTGLGGLAIAQILLAIFIDVALRMSLMAIIAFIGIVIGRTVVGVFHASVPTINTALVADHVPSEDRTAALAAIGTAGAVGMMVGPALTGLVGSSNFSLGLYLTAPLPLLAWFIIWLALPHDVGHVQERVEPLTLMDRRIRGAVLINFSTAFSIMVIEVMVGFFVQDRLGLTPSRAAEVSGIAMAVLGASVIPAQLAVIKLKLPPNRLLRSGTLIAATGLLVTSQAHNSITIYLAYGLTAMGFAWLFPAASAICADAVESHEQGAAAGAMSSAMGVGTVLGPIVGTSLYAVHTSAPYLAVAGLMIACFFLKTHAGRAAA